MSNHHEHDGGPAAQPCDDTDLQCQVCKQMKEMRVVTADELLQGHREMLILHAGQVYRLMRTRNDKLILQK
ncbi:MAG: hemin uptake protein HemP [Thermoguttaceae bacterium]